MHSGHLNLIVGTHGTYADTDILSACIASNTEVNVRHTEHLRAEKVDGKVR